MTVSLERQWPQSSCTLAAPSTEPLPPLVQATCRAVLPVLSLAFTSEKLDESSKNRATSVVPAADLTLAFTIGMALHAAPYLPLPFKDNILIIAIKILLPLLFFFFFLFYYYYYYYYYYSLFFLHLPSFLPSVLSFSIIILIIIIIIVFLLLFFILSICILEACLQAMSDKNLVPTC